MKRLLACLLVLVGLVVVGCEIDADEDVRLGDNTAQVEVTVQQ